VSASWINKLNEDNGRLHKEDVIRQALAAAKLGNDISHRFLRYAKACYNPYTTFGVKQIPDTVGIVNAANPWGDFSDLLLSLSYRQLIGHAARDAITEMSERFDSDEWNLFLAPILRRDMRCGISATTINKVVKNTDYEIPVFSCQLATNCENRPEMKGSKRLEPKLDGVRALMLIFPGSRTPAGQVSCLSRNGKVFENFRHIEQQIQDNLSEITQAISNVGGFSSSALKKGFVLDGEIVGNSFQALMRQARRKENVSATDSVFHVFDIIPVDDFQRGFWNAPLRTRISFLDAIQNTINKMPNVKLLPCLMVDLDTHEGKSNFTRYCNDMVAEGYEGVMIKDMDAPYVCTRSTYWMKYKPVITVDLQIIGVEEGTGRNKGRLGAVVCNGVDDNKEITVNVGSGFSDGERDSFWRVRNFIVGRTVEVMADAITQNQDGTYSLRFPRFVRFRDDKQEL
jgi:DNA ligase 1